MINTYSKANVDAKPYIQPGTAGNYDGMIAWDVEVTNIPLTYKLGFEGDGHVDWGDGTSEDLVKSSYGSVTHIYADSGTFTITLAGTVTDFYAGESTTSRNVVRTIQSMSLPNYIGTTNYHKFSYCSYATIGQNFKFADSILYLNGVFYKCNNIVSFPETFTLPPNVISISRAFSYIGNNATMPASFTIPSTVTAMIGCFAGNYQIKFESNLVIPESCTNITSLFNNSRRPNLHKVVLHSGLTNMELAFANTWHTESPVWPSSFSASSINVNEMFYNYEVSELWQRSSGFLGGAASIPADLFWGDTTKTWQHTDTFHNAKHIYNYSSIPSSWK